MKRKILLLIVGILSINLSFSQLKSDSIREKLLDIHSKHVLVVAHRADWRNSPENSLQAVRNCIDQGVDMVEIDLKKTKDGELIILHDKTLDRTTTGKGKPEDYTLEELRKFNLKNGAGHPTSHGIPTLEEVMLLCKGKILVNVDHGYGYFEEVYVILEKTGTVDQCVIKAGLPYSRVKAENEKVLDKVIFMPIVDLNNDNALQMIEEYHKGLNPVAFELVFKNDNPTTIHLIQKTKKTGARIFINSLWPELCGGHDDDRAVEQGQPDESWGWIIDQGARLIQTDRPEQLLVYLREKGLHD